MMINGSKGDMKTATIKPEQILTNLIYKHINMF